MTVAFRTVRGKGKFTCPVAFCRNRSAKEFDKCSKHKMQAWRAANPLAAAFANLRSSAKTRGVAFTLTLAEFTEFCQRTGYLDKKGNRDPEALQVDRVDCTRGYAADNIRVLTLAENGKKGQREFYIHRAAATAALPFAETDHEENPY